MVWNNQEQVAWGTMRHVWVQGDQEWEVQEMVESKAEERKLLSGLTDETMAVGMLKGSGQEQA